jgi:hypothetical protein
MPVTRVWTCDLTDCTNRAVGDDVPEGWALVRKNAAGVTDNAFCSDAHLVTWYGATLIPREITVAEARAVLAKHRAELRQTTANSSGPT